MVLITSANDMTGSSRLEALLLIGRFTDDDDVGRIEVVASQDQLNRFCSSQGAPGVVLQSEADIQRAKEGLPEGLLPFMTIEQSGLSDVYAFDFSTTPPSVVVWAGDAIVECWDSFDRFLEWTKR